MVDRFFADSALAQFYDDFFPIEDRRDFAFYLPLVMSAGTVLDVGCGTGALLHEARRRGHKGRLYGVDPGAGMIEQARKRTDIEWVQGTLDSVDLKGGFELVVMTGHAFQVFVEDEELQGLLRAVQSHLSEDGCFVFETRNPLGREWEHWPSESIEIHSQGQQIRMMCDLDEPFDGKVLRFSLTFTSPGWIEPRVSRSTLRFIDEGTLSSFLEKAGFEIQAQFGDWDRQHLTAESPQIITIARTKRSRHCVVQTLPHE